jgi:predicted Zn-dependent protease
LILRLIIKPRVVSLPGVFLFWCLVSTVVLDFGVILTIMHAMIPEIADNATFLRYQQIWSANPSSVVFAPLAEMLILHKCYEEAITVCKKGLEKNPKMISGRVALARAYVHVGNYNRATQEVQVILGKYPAHTEALEISKICEGHQGASTTKVEGSSLPRQVKSVDPFAASTLNPVEDNRWYTVTMAEIYAAQGNLDMAKKIYNGLLEREPENIKAKKGLEKLSKRQDSAF